MTISRQAAIALFDRADTLLTAGVPALENFGFASRIIEDELTRAGSPATRLQIRRYLDRVDSWPAFWRSFAGHRLFSEPAGATRETFRAVWHQISGFDTDGLLEIGDPDALSTRGDSPILARHQLYTLFSNHQSILEADPGDAHVHFGQYTDLNLIWLMQINSTHLPSGDPIAAPTGMRMAFGEFSKNEARNYVLGAEELKFWARCTLECGLLFSILTAESDQSAMFNEYLSVRADAQKLGKLAAKLRRGLPIAGGTGLGRLVALERKRILAPVARGDLAWLGGAALAYVILKNGAFHRLLSNSVSSFQSFSRALRILDHVYRRSGSELLNIEALDVLRQNLSTSRSTAQSVRYLIRPAALSDGSFPTALNRALLQLRMLDSERLVVAFHRDDFETVGERDLLAVFETVPPMLQASKGATLVGVDLVGPEVLHSGRAGAPIGSSSLNHLLKSTDFAFRFREILEKSTPDNRALFASFHCMEEITDFSIGLLNLLVTLLDPRFRRGVDRVSHALFHIDRPSQEVFDPSLSLIFGVLLGRVTQLLVEEPPRSAVFGRADRLKLKSALKRVKKGQMSKQVQAKISELTRAAIEDGRVVLEICPSSNEMILRQSLALKADSHPWRHLRAQRSTHVGTDDPSITQATPWIERLLLAG